MDLTCASTIIFFKLLRKKLQEWRSVTGLGFFFKLLARHKFMLAEAVFAARGIDGFSKHFRFFRGGNRVYWCLIYFLWNTLVAGAGVKAWIQVPVKEMCFYLCGCGPRFACSSAKHSCCCWEGELGKTTVPFLTWKRKGYFCRWGVQWDRGNFNVSMWGFGGPWVTCGMYPNLPCSITPLDQWCESPGSALAAAWRTGKQG